MSVEEKSETSTTSTTSTTATTTKFEPSHSNEPTPPPSSTSSSLSSSIPQKERPCRTLFVRNVAFHMNEGELHHMFGAFGPMHRFFSIVPTRGMCFVTYFDIRHAENARRAMNEYAVLGRPISVHFSTPDHRDKDADTQQTGTIFLILRRAPRPLDHRDVGHYFARYGDILQVRDRKGSAGSEFFVEFFDTRAALAAQRENDHRPLFGGQAEVVIARPSALDGQVFQELVNQIVATNPRALPDLGSGPPPLPPSHQQPPPQQHHMLPPGVAPHPSAAAAAAAAAAMLQAQQSIAMMPPPPPMSMMPPPPQLQRDVSPGPAAAATIAALYGADARDPWATTTGGPMRNAAADHGRNMRAQARWEAPLGASASASGAMYPPPPQQQQQTPFVDASAALYGGGFDPAQLQMMMMQPHQPLQTPGTPSAQHSAMPPQTPPHLYGGPTSLYASAPPSQSYAQSIIPMYQSPVHPPPHEYVPQPVGAGRPGTTSSGSNIVQQMSQLTQLLKRPEALSALLNAKK